MQYPTIEKAIIKAFITNKSYVMKVMPFINPEYFRLVLEKEIVREAMQFYTDFHELPTEAALIITVSKKLPAHENRVELNEYVKSLADVEVDQDWLIKQSETFFRERDFSLTLAKAAEVEAGIGKLTMYDIPPLMQKSMAITFEQSVSHDYFRDIAAQNTWYKEKADKIPFNMEILDQITCGGAERKTLNVLMAGTGVGKTLFMCHFAGKYLQQGYNVLYLSLEISKEKIRQRVDSNLLDVPMDNFALIEDELYFSKIRRLKETVTGNLKVHEYPSATISVNHIKRLLEELAMKDNFKPDILFIDYLNLMISARYRDAKKYEVVEAAAQECRGLASEYGLCIWTGTQLNREGYKSTKVGVENTSQSMGLPETSDFFLALTADKSLQRAQHVRCEQLKSRYAGKKILRTFIVGVDEDKQRVFNVVQPEEKPEAAPQEKDEGSSFDKSAFGRGMRGERSNSFATFDFDPDI